MYPTTVALGSDGVLWLLCKQDIEHRVRCPKNRTITRCKPHKKKLPNVSHNPNGWAMPRKDQRNQTLRKSWARNSTHCHWGTGIPCNNKRAHARVVSKLLIISLHKNYQFSMARFKANASNIFLLEESQMYL